MPQMHNCWIVLLLLLYSWTSAYCAQVSVGQYYVTPPTSFRGVDPDLTGCFTSAGELQCFNNGILTDSNTVPSSVDLNSPEYVQLFFSWSEAVQKPYISFSFVGERTIATIGLSFLNYPSEMIGLPNFEVFQTDNPISQSGGTEIIYTLRNNGELTSDDQKVATVYLDLFPASGVTLEFIRIEISFSGLYNTDYFLLNEVTFESTRMDTNFPTISFDQADTSLQVFSGHTLQLTCTVTVDGQFQWKWMRGDQTLVDSSQVQMETTLATRTGVLTITDICTTNSSTYTCEARQVGTISIRGKSRTTVVTVSSNALVEVGTPVMGLLGAAVDLTCFVSDYQGDPANITWAREEAPDAPLQDSSPKYTIARSNQTLSGGVSGCSSVSVNVTIHNLASGDMGTYICSAGADSQATTNLTVLHVDPSLPDTPTGQASSTTTSSTSPAAPPVTPGSSNAPKGGSPDGSSGGGGDGAAIAGGVVLGVVFLVVLIGTVILVVIVFKRRSTTTKVEHRDLRQNGTQNDDSDRRSRKYTADDIEWQLYSSVNKPPPPPIPAQNFDPADTNSEHHELNQTNLQEPPPNLPPRRMTGFSQGKPKLAKLNGDISKYKMCDNPLYQSAVEIDQTEKEEEETSFADNLELHIYADPTVETSTPTTTYTYSSSGGEEPIYSEALEPHMFSEELTPNEGDLRPYGPIYAEPQPLSRSEAPLEVTSDHIQEIRNLGIGEFGAVVLAETVGISLQDLNLSTTDNDRTVHIQVAVKKLKPHADASVRTSFEREIKFMSRLKNENIVRLLAICTSDSPFIVMEYMENGDLNQYLRNHQLAEADSVIIAGQLPASLLVYMAVQIASGMRYLASMNFVHRDMATRNCLVGKNFVVKIADFGMSKSLYEHAYYRVRGRAKLPIRWMATECFYGRFSEKSDVWAFGVTIWEIFVLGKQQPYEEIDDQELIQDAIRGSSRQLLERPQACPAEIYEVMLRCWEYEAECRASFEEIFSSLAAIHQQM